MKKTREQHGLTDSPTYTTWQDMKARCSNKNDKKYKIYGGRGITVCGRWNNSFIAFLEDMGERPKGMSIERIDNNKGYYPENCKWATYGEQNRNHSRNRKITIGGETKCLIDWVEEGKLKYNTILYRIRRGWSPEEAIRSGLTTGRNQYTIKI